MSSCDFQITLPVCLSKQTMPAPLAADFRDEVVAIDQRRAGVAVAARPLGLPLLADEDGSEILHVSACHSGFPSAAFRQCSSPRSPARRRDRHRPAACTAARPGSGCPGDRHSTCQIAFPVAASTAPTSLPPSCRRRTLSRPPRRAMRGRTRQPRARRYWRRGKRVGHRDAVGDVPVSHRTAPLRPVVGERVGATPSAARGNAAQGQSGHGENSTARRAMSTQGGSAAATGAVRVISVL